MKRYILTAFLSFRPRGACFLIPCYSCNGSNASYGHEVDETGKAFKFYKIEPKNYFTDINVPLNIIKREGEYALFAVRLADEKVIFGTVNELCEQLAMIDLHSKGGPFFNIDAFAFMGKMRKRNQAISAARPLFSDKAVARSWSAREKRIESHGLTSFLPKEIAHTVFDSRAMDWLIANTDSEDWPEHWLRAWQYKQMKAPLRRLAFEWMTSSRQSDGDYKILSALLRDVEAIDRATMMSLQWLRREPCFRKGWSGIWFAVSETHEGIRNKKLMLDMGIDFLRQEASPVSGKTWTRVWRRLDLFLQNNFDRFFQDVLYELAREKIQIYANDKFFQRGVLWHMVSHFELKAHEIISIINWMVDAAVSNVWIAVYIRLSKGQHLIPTQLQKKALTFLERDGARLSSWKALWDHERRNETSVMFDQIAVNWLKRSDPKMTCWLEVLEDLLKRNAPYPELYMMAVERLKSGERNGALLLHLRQWEQAKRT